MDSKSLAKSKRAHSQHHKNKSYPNQKSKGPSLASDSVGTAKKPLGKQVGEKTRQSQRIGKLPSNWDRYEDEFGLDSENPSGDSTSQASDVIVPKSKGADYHHLIAEAQSQAQSQSYSFSDSVHHLDDIMPGGFIQGVGPLLSVRGEGILSWAGDDNFVVEDKTTGVQEASFLSLNLNALAEQLAKVHLSQRLFVDADLLSSELGAEGSMASSYQESNQMQTMHESDSLTNMSEDIASDEFSVEVKIVDTESTQFGSPSSQVETSHPTVSSKGPDFMNRIKDDLNSSELADSEQRGALKPTAQLKENTVAVSNSKPTEFEAAAAEAELDTLLDSFGETKFFDSSGSNSSNTFTYVQQASSTSLPQLSRSKPDLAKTATVTSSFDDVLDDLLQETSNLANQNGLSQPSDIKVVPHDAHPSSHTVAKSKELEEDFDSWLDSF